MEGREGICKFYFKSIIPSVTYSISVWGNCSPPAMNSLNSIHATASCIVNNLQLLLADHIRLIESDWLPLSALSYFFKKAVLMLMHKVCFETSCQYVWELFSKNSTFRWTWFPNHFNIIRFKSYTGRNTSRYRDPVIWNFVYSLVEVLKNFYSKQILKKHARGIVEFCQQGSDFDHLFISGINCSGKFHLYLSFVI